MDEKKFTQGMSHADAESKDLGFAGLKSADAFNNLWSNFTGLKDRPDYDGFVSIQEGVDWAKGHPGALENPTPENMLYIDASKLNFGNLSTSDFQSINKTTPINLLNTHNFAVSADNETVRGTVYALGRVNMILTNRENRSVQIVNDFSQPSRRATDYDWNGGGGMIRSTLIDIEHGRTGLNDTHGFRVYYYGTGTLNPPMDDQTIRPSQYR